MEVVVYYDGKLCRGISGRMVRRLSRSILIELDIIEWDEEKDCEVEVTEARWFRKRGRERGGTYECDGYNYWYYGRVRK